MQDCPQNKLVLACATSNPVRNTENDPLAAKRNGSPGGVARGLRFSHLEIPEPFAKHQSCPKGPWLAAGILLQCKYCRKVVIQPHPWWQAENRAWEAEVCQDCHVFTLHSRPQDSTVPETVRVPPCSSGETKAALGDKPLPKSTCGSSGSSTSCIKHPWLCLYAQSAASESWSNLDWKGPLQVV